MSYHLKATESVPSGIKRIVREEIDSAIGLLKGNAGGNKDEAIHETRKSVKKIRGALRLVSAELGDTYRLENKELRSASLRLSELRNATAIIEVFDDLREKYRDELGRQTGTRIRQALVKRKHRVDREAHVEEAMSWVAATLQAVGKRVKAWPLEADGFEAIRPGLKTAFRRARQSLAFARKHRASEDFHEWRKCLKYHWYQVRLLERLWTDMMVAYEKSLKDVETWLGDDHNLVVLRDALLTDPEFRGSDKEVDLCIPLIEKHQKLLRDSALSQGERIYDQKPKQFAARMKHLWIAWQAEPKSVSKLQKKSA